jgi:hypothetical protein
VVVIVVIAVAWIMSLIIRIRKNKGASLCNSGRVEKPKIKHFTDTP